MKTLLRFAFWTIWFVILPTLLSGALVWVLTPAEGAVPTGFFGHIQAIVGDQRVPAAIVFFTIFVSLLWSQRYVLPLAGYAIGGRQDVPLAARKQVEAAYALLEEVRRIQRRNHKAIEKKLSEEDREALKAVLDELTDRINEESFDMEAFEEALSQAQDAVDTWLGPWRKGEAREYGESIAIAVVVALLLRSFVIEAFKIPSRSMVPTLEVGDHIFVNKFSYGPLIPFTSKRLFENLPPKRGDVMVFQFPEDPKQDFIKRVVGLPGDKIEAIGGRPRINGLLIPRCRVGPLSYREDHGTMALHQGDLFVEYLGEEAFLTFDDRTYQTYEANMACKVDKDCPRGQACADGKCGDYQGPYTVAPRQTFMMGDNRMNSYDSRAWFEGKGGGVPFSYIRGRALWIWMSFRPEGGIAWDRVGISVMGRPKLPPAFQAKIGKKIAYCMNHRPPLSASTPPPPLKK